MRYAYFTGVETPDYIFAFNQSVTAGIIPTNDGAACVFVGSPSERPSEGRAQALAGMADRRPDTDIAFARMLADASPLIAGQVSAATRVSPYRGTPGLPGFLRRAYGAGWALVGDAGYHRDPISAHGITDAFRDAELLARALHATLAGEADEVGTLSGYQVVRDEYTLPVSRQPASSPATAGTGPAPSSCSVEWARPGGRGGHAGARLPPWPGDVAGTGTGGEPRAA